MAIRKPMLFLVALLATTSWSVEATTRGQKRRQLFGERWSPLRGEPRGGAGGVAKGFDEFIPMMTRAVIPAPSPSPTASASATGPPTTVTDIPATGVPTVASSTTGTEAPTTRPLGCLFVAEDGTETTFDEGESLGSFSTLSECTNGASANFPCLCASGEPDQTFCPYCVEVDAFDNTLCLVDGEALQFIDSETNSLTECTCRVIVEQTGDRLDFTFNYTLETTCEEVTINGGQQGPPTMSPTQPAPVLTRTPIAAPSSSPTVDPTESPVFAPTTPAPVASPTQPPTSRASEGPPVEPTFVMGRLTKVENELTLSEGLSSRIIARTSQPVLYGSGRGASAIPFHRRPSGGDTFVDTRPNNPGGWIYVSNSEAAAENGGVGALTFDSAGEVINYEMLLEGTKANSAGGRTPWDSWVSGERDLENLNGQIYQVDPFGVRDSSVLHLTGTGGAWEGFAYDFRSPNDIDFFMSEDFVFGAVRKFTPSVINTEDPWLMLEDEMGIIQYLLLEPIGVNQTSGTYSWTDQIMIARGNAAQNYPEAQGIDVNENTLSFVCRGIRQLFQIDLDGNTYTRTPTNQGLMEGEPNEVRYKTANNGATTLLYMTEANGRRSGIHARDEATGVLFPVLEGFYQPYTSGFALSPDGKHMYLAFKRDGILFEITRDDGLSFFDAMTFEEADTSAVARQHGH